MAWYSPEQILAGFVNQFIHVGAGFIAKGFRFVLPGFI
jgi:hypothetical protein